VADLFCPEQFTPADKLRSVERELKYRRYVYPARVASLKMKKAEADREIAIFEAIAEDYRGRVT
jgi:hypothetical protein